MRARQYVNVLRLITDIFGVKYFHTVAHAQAATYSKITGFPQINNIFSQEITTL